MGQPDLLIEVCRWGKSVKRKAASKRKMIPKKQTEQIVARLGLKLIRLIHSESVLNLIAEGQPPKQTKVRVQVGFGRTRNGTGYRGQLAFDMTAHDEASKKPSIVLRCTLQMVYELITGPEPTVREIKAQEAPISAMVGFQGWPYVREHVQSMTSKMGLPPLVLPQFLLTGGKATFRSPETAPSASMSAK